MGFILNKRRIMVCWVHPRMAYRDQIETTAYSETGELPTPDLFEPAEKNGNVWLVPVKMMTSWVTHPPQDALREYFDKVNGIIKRKESDGIDWLVRPTMVIKTLYWCTGIELCVPLEVRNKEEVVALAALVQQLIKGEKNLKKMFPDYQYGRKEWFMETEMRTEDMIKKQTAFTTDEVTTCISLGPGGRSKQRQFERRTMPYKGRNKPLIATMRQISYLIPTQ